MMAERIAFDNFSDFWLFYVGEHSVAANRWLHFVGTTCGHAILIYACITQNWLLLPLGLVVGYGMAWVGHFFVEKNRPASFQYPGWSFIADQKMWFYILVGKMKREVDRAAVASNR